MVTGIINRSRQATVISRRTQQRARVTVDSVDFYDPRLQAIWGEYLADLDEAERRGGCFFAQMGAIAAGRHAAEQSALTPTRE